MAETTDQYRTRINQLNASIKNEPYIEKMRSDIAEGVSKTGNRQADIEDQFKDVIEGTTGKDVISAPEIIAARKGEASLNARLTKNETETTAQFQQTKTEVTAQLALTEQEISTLSTKVGTLGATSTFKGSATNSVIISKTGMDIGDEWYDTTNNQSLRWNGNDWVNVGNSIRLGEKVVNTENTTFIKSSTNLLDVANEEKGKLVNSSGMVTDSVDYATAPEFKVKKVENLYVVGVNYVSFYDEEGVFRIRKAPSNIDGAIMIVEPTHTTAVPSYNMRSTHYANGTLQINYGDVELPYEPYYKDRLEEYVDIGERPLANNAVEERHISPKSVSPDKTTFLRKSTNLLDLGTLTDNKLINSSGELVDNNDYMVSDFIIVEPIQDMSSFGVIQWSVYNKDGAFGGRRAIALSSDNMTGVFKTLSDTSKIRVNINKKLLTGDVKPHLNKGSTLLSYEPSGLIMSGVTLDNQEEKTDIEEEFQSHDNFISSDTFMVDGKLDGVYESPELDAYLNVESDWMPPKIYAMFDALVAQYPEYVTKTILGKDSSGLYDVNRYDFKPPEVRVIIETKRPKMIFMAGNHGYEKTHPYVLYMAMKQLCENWGDNELLETIRWNAHLIVLPCTNPHSFSLNSRVNANGVDLSRNFEWRWDMVETGPGTSKGTHPLSEVEAQYIDSVLRENQEDAISFISLHNFSTPAETPTDFIWYPANSQLQRHIGRELISKLSRMWKKTYDWLPSDDGTYFGYVDAGATWGAEGGQASLYGISGGTFETSRIMMLEDSPVNSSSIAVTMAVDSLINLMILNLKHGVDYYNRHKKVEKLI